MLSRSALIVDDERDIRELVGIALSRMGLRVETAADLASARAQLALHDFDLCITDMRLPDGNGLALVEHIAAAHPRTAVAMMTAYGNVEAAVAALKAGAFDFVTKPVDLAVLRQLVTHALNQQVQRRAAEAAVPRLVGGSAAACALRERIAKVARSHAPVFIGGEPGSGKALVARLVHAASPRREGPRRHWPDPPERRSAIAVITASAAISIAGPVRRGSSSSSPTVPARTTLTLMSECFCWKPVTIDWMDSALPDAYSVTVLARTAGAATQAAATERMLRRRFMWIPVEGYGLARLGPLSGRATASTWPAAGHSRPTLASRR